MEQAWKYPTSKFIWIHLRSKLQVILSEIDLQLLKQKLGAIVQRLGCTLRTTNQFLFFFLVSHLDIKNQGVFIDNIHDRRIIQLTQRATHIVNEMFVAVYVLRFLNKSRHIMHRSNLS